MNDRVGIPESRPPGGGRAGSRPPRGTLVLRTTIVLVGVLLGAIAVPAAASAAATPGTVARALERSPVYIDPALDGQISPAAAGRIERAIEASGEEVRVALVPPADEDGGFEEARAFAAALRSRAPFDGILVTTDDRYLVVDERRDRQQVRRDEVRDAATLANYADEAGDSFRRTLLERVERFLANLRQSPRRLAARVAADEARKEAEQQARPRRDPGSRSGDDGGAGVVPVLLLLVVLGLLVAAVVLVRRRRRGAVAADGPLPVVPARVFEHARAAERAELQEDADGELLALATLLDEHPVPRDERAQDAYQRALDAYAAARRRAADGAPTVDLVGVLVLVDRARGDLAAASTLEAGGRPAAWTPLCTFHPLHGRSARTVRWERGLRIPACSACAADLRAGRDPDALRDGDRPYFEGDTVWARTGYGAFGDDLVGRLSRGD